VVGGGWHTGGVSTARDVASSWQEMPWLTRLVVRAIERERPPVRHLDVADLPGVRAFVAPARPPYTWVTGPVRRGVSITTSSFRARDGAQVPVRVYRPDDVGGRLPCVVYLHGGGWVLGSPAGYDPLCSALAGEARVVVVSVDYRLAPEHPAPQGLLDCVDAVRWAAASGDRLGWRPTRLGIAGDSAGGNLAAVVTHVLRDEGGADLRHQALLYPAVDASMSLPSVSEHALAPILTRADMEVFLDHYVGTEPEALDRLDPRISPLHADDHSRLPPALVVTADLDPLRDEGIAYARLLEQAGVEVRHVHQLRAPHGFLSFPGATPGGRAARRALIHWIAGHAHAAGSTKVRDARRPRRDDPT
jgi:acetyl esterase